MPNNNKNNVIQLVAKPVIEPVHEFDSSNISDEILEGSVGMLKKALIIGHTLEGTHYVVATTAHKGELLLMIKDFENRLLNGEYD